MIVEFTEVDRPVVRCLAASEVLPRVRAVMTRLREGSLATGNVGWNEVSRNGDAVTQARI